MPAYKRKTPPKRGCQSYKRPSGALARFLIAKFAAQDLAHVGLGQFIAELEGLRHLIGGQALAAEFAQFIFLQARIGSDQEHLDDLTALVVRNANGGAFKNLRMAADHVLDLVRVYVEPGDDDHV